MATVVFLRAVNVGGHQAFKPSVLARELTELDVVSIGAAGTFVVRQPASRTVVRAEFKRRLPFETEFMVCPGRELRKLAVAPPEPGEDAATEVQRFVSVLAKRPRTLPDLPISKPADDQWQVRVVRVQGNFAISLRRRIGKADVYPNEVVEKHLGVAATTRNWNTVEAICALLDGTG